MAIKVAVSCSLIELALFGVFWALVMERHFRMSAAYPFYAVRDRFVYLVASGHLKENSLLFQECYKAINRVIVASQNMDATEVIRTIVSLRAVLKMRSECVSVPHEEVQEAVASLFEAAFYFIETTSPHLISQIPA